MQRLLLSALIALGLTSAGTLVGCDEEISHEEKTTVTDEGKVTKESETVTEKADGTIVKEEEKTVKEPEKVNQ